MAVMKDSIFAPHSTRNLVVTASLAMALSMGVAPGIALAEEPAVDGAPTISRVENSAPVVETPLVANVETQPADTSRTITRAPEVAVAAPLAGASDPDQNADQGKYGDYRGQTVGEYNPAPSEGGDCDSTPSEGGDCDSTPSEGGDCDSTPSTIGYFDPTSHYNSYYNDHYNNYYGHGVWDNYYGYNYSQGDCDSNYNHYVNYDHCDHSDSSDAVEVVSVGTGNLSSDQSSQNNQAVNPVNHGTISIRRDNAAKLPAPDLALETKAAEEQLTGYVDEALSTSDLARQLGVDNVMIIGEPELKPISEDVFEISLMPQLGVENPETDEIDSLAYWWYVYIDGAKTRVMDAVGNLAEGIDRFVWSPEGTVDPTTFDGNVVFAQDPGLTVVMTASSELGVEAVTVPVEHIAAPTPSVVPDDAEAPGTVPATVDSAPLPSTGDDEPTVPLGNRIASYIPNKAATTPAVAAAAETIETLAATADHTDSRPVVAWGVAGVVTLLFATMRKRREER